ncbi:uncharacterized protein LOC130642076 isoform X2 [Hydractinia symbiolongicarpus]|uniref:uncharacterized protein LOC130642076 isoform X2 n=1 Tax=Hydractinia symbiolongicarpus TaxID=13093 RepID=UPI002551200D|nr:uncharacterized protein LOC130642076 isoform X2 [Hydractinia symbiolongicarpus]
MIFVVRTYAMDILYSPGNWLHSYMKNHSDTIYIFKMQRIISNEIQLPDGRVGVPIYIQPSVFPPLIYPCHVITLRICGFGVTSIITGIIGLTLTFRMHFSALNGTYMTSSAINVIYASFHGMRYASLDKLFCKFIGATAMACMGISLVAIVFCMKTNICCPSCHAYDPERNSRYGANAANIDEIQPNPNVCAPQDMAQLFESRNICSTRLESPPAYTE